MVDEEKGKHTTPDPPQAYKKFIDKFPKLAEAWSLIGQGGRDGPLDAKSARLIKLAVAIGSLREGAVHANVRKALSEGIDREEIEQIVALAAGTLGLPATAAAYTWTQDVLEKR
ncbi:MAG: carboxymuconolactone decarboxylase family protein [Myxococcota bacterium]|nr:carboxymuconolactone decarboxylase family protein [Myxococcota bacterium]